MSSVNVIVALSLPPAGAQKVDGGAQQNSNHGGVQVSV